MLEPIGKVQPAIETVAQLAYIHVVLILTVYMQHVISY